MFANRFPFLPNLLGRAPRKEEDPQGSRKEENHIYPTIRERYDDRWEEEGEFDTFLFKDLTCYHHSLTISFAFPIFLINFESNAPPKQKQPNVYYQTSGWESDSQTPPKMAFYLKAQA